MDQPARCILDSSLKLRERDFARRRVSDATLKAKEVVRVVLSVEFDKVGKRRDSVGMVITITNVDMRAYEG